MSAAVRHVIRYVGPSTTPLPETVMGPGELEEASVFDVPEGGLLTIGRRSGNDIVLASNAVAGVHALVCGPKNTNVVLVDLNTTNGTEVDGVRVPVHFLQPGHEFVVAGWFRFRLEALEESGA
jgi:pSer/pThr/pTyr-binding forkhead associated (FHA) protein